MSYRIKNFALLLLLLTGLSETLIASPAEELFTSQCARCHFTSDSVRVGTAAVTKALTQGNIKKHRFTLTKTEKQLLIKYLCESEQ